MKPRSSSDSSDAQRTSRKRSRPCDEDEPREYLLEQAEQKLIGATTQDEIEAAREPLRMIHQPF